MYEQTQGAASPSQRYQTALSGQLAADGCNPRWEEWATRSVLVGQRADWRMATRLHLFAIAAAVPEISVAEISDFALSASAYAKEHKPGLPLGVGFMTLIVLFPCLVSEKVDPAAIAWAEAGQSAEWAAVLARPVVVDMARGAVGTFRGSEFVGVLYSKHQRAKLALYFDGALRDGGRQ